MMLTNIMNDRLGHVKEKSLIRLNQLYEYVRYNIKMAVNCFQCTHT